MFETVATFKSEDDLLKSHSGFSPALAQRLSVLILLLAVALATTSCGTLAQATGAQNNATPNHLNLYGNFPAGTVSESYNAVLAVGGGKFPYHFSVKTGALPPGISLNPTTGSFSGKPTSAGAFSFEVIVTDAPNLDQGNKTFVINVSGGTQQRQGQCVSGQRNFGLESEAAVYRHRQRNFQYRCEMVGVGRLGRCQRSVHCPNRNLANQRGCQSHQQCGLVEVGQRRQSPLIR